MQLSNNQSTLYLDMITSDLRNQITTLKSVLENIERTNRYDDEYIDQSLKSTEIALNRLRKIINE